MIAGLPYDAEVEYLESTGTQYIDTGYVPNSTTAFELSAAYTGNDGLYNRLFGTQKDGEGKTLTIRSGDAQGGTYYVESGSGAYYGTFDTDKHTFSFSDGAAYIDGVMLFSNRPPSNQITGSAWLWGNNNVEQRHARAKVYLCKLQDGTTLIRDLIAVRFTNELGVSEGAMYDRVSRKLFRNAGTGALTIGPDVATPVMGLHFMPRPKYTARDYVQKGLVAMWDGIENAGWGVHDPNATTLKNLTGDSSLDFDVSGMEVGQNFINTNNVVSTTAGGVPESDFTIEAVARLSDGQGMGASHIGWESYYLEYGDRIGYAPTSSWGTVLFIRYTGTSGLVGATSCGTNAQDNKYNDLSAWSGQSGMSGFRAMYKNGVAMNLTAWEPRTFTRTPTDDNKFTIGVMKGENGNQIASNPDTRHHLLYGLRFYNRLLDVDEIAHNYAVDKERFNLP